MIVQGKRFPHKIGGSYTVDIEIDPFEVLCQVSKDWRLSIGVALDSVIMGGYWMYYDSVDDTHTRIRLATRDEIVRFDAIKNVTELTATFYE